MAEPAIIVDNLHKSFRLPHEKHSTLKQAVLNWRRRSYEEFKVLNGISFEVKKGEFFGIVGRNGSGKSTLLKTLAGIYVPDKGGVKINGKLTPFIELGIGFNPELTGRDNVYLNGAILGLSRQEIDAKYREIVEFAELEKFMDQKLKNYSSGMQVRLAFAVAIQAQSDILLLDEVLAVGDKSFQQKCYNYFKELKRLNRTVIFISHDISVVQQFCKNGILIDNGVILKKGRIGDVIHAYNNLLSSHTKKISTTSKLKRLEESEDPQAKIIKVYTQNSNQNKQTVFDPYEEIQIVFEIKPQKDITSIAVGMVLQSADDITIFATNTVDQKVSLKSLKKEKVYKVIFYLDNILDDGTYFISGAVASSDRLTLYHRVLRWNSFKTIGWNTTAKAPVYPKHKITFSN